MKSFNTWDKIEIAYQEWGEESASPPVVLHHGFVVDANANWVVTGVVDALLEAGHRVIAPRLLREAARAGPLWGAAHGT
jgi:pimeloyl-ACP methyl ester carboxylesterase